jgi:flagellar protein FlaF
MYQFSYAEIVEDTCGEARLRERQALEHAIGLLCAARDAGPESRESIEALRFVCTLWGVLIEDLASPENDLPESLRAGLISIGLWIMREADNIRAGRTVSYDDLIEINQTICDGLK